MLGEYEIQFNLLLFPKRSASQSEARHGTTNSTSSLPYASNGGKFTNSLHETHGINDEALASNKKAPKLWNSATNSCHSMSIKQHKILKSHTAVIGGRPNSTLLPWSNSYMIYIYMFIIYTISKHIRMIMICIIIHIRFLSLFWTN